MNFKIGDVIKPNGYNEQHTVVEINDKGYVLENDFKIQFDMEDAFVLVNI